MFYSLLETNDEQSTVDMSLRDLAEAGSIRFPYLFFFYMYFLKMFSERQKGGSVAEWSRAPIRRSWVQGLHPATSGICFSVVPNSNPRSRFVNSQLVCLLPVGSFNCVTFI